MKFLYDIFAVLIMTTMFIVSLVGRDILNIVDHYERVASSSVIEDITPVAVNIEAIKVTDSVEIHNQNDTLSKKEWFPFKGFKYDLQKHNWSKKHIIMFTNVLYRESKSRYNKHDEIDQYLVAITAIRRYTDKGHMFFRNKFVGAFRKASTSKPKFYKNKAMKEKAWKGCYEVVKNVLAGKIPDYIPYIPHGTSAYLNSRLEGKNSDYRKKHKINVGWVNTCQTEYAIVASTVKDHHYYANPKLMTTKEINHLKRNPHNPVNTEFKDGYFALMK